MTLQSQYTKLKENILADKKICKENRNLIKRTLARQEKRLRRLNGIEKLDERTFKTLYGYLIKYKNVNRFFSNKPIKNIDKKVMAKVFDDFFDGVILNARGKSFKDKKSYRDKIFCSILFEEAGKDKIAKKLLRDWKEPNNKKVKFITLEDFKKIVNKVFRIEHKTLLWLLFDLGENISTVLELEKKDFERRIDKDTGEVEYIVRLEKEKLKRSRTPRTIVTNFSETAKLLDEVLEAGKLFNFGLRQSEKMFARAVKLSGVKTNQGDEPTLKTLRSSMACFLLSQGVSQDLIKKRLGHKPSSTVIDDYATYLAVEEGKPKKQINLGIITEMKEKLSKKDNLIHSLQDEVKVLNKKIDMVVNELVKSNKISKKQGSKIIDDKAKN